MRYLFLLNPTAGKRDCTAELAPAIQAAAQRAGIPPEKRKVVVTQYAGHARELAAEAAHTAQADGEPRRQRRQGTVCASGQRAATAPSTRR